MSKDKIINELISPEKLPLDIDILAEIIYNNFNSIALGLSEISSKKKARQQSAIETILAIAMFETENWETLPEKEKTVYKQFAVKFLLDISKFGPVDPYAFKSKEKISKTNRLNSIDD